MKTQKGITLISLIITVIVMLILSAVTISMVIGENGIVQKAGEVTIEQEAQAGKEKLAMDLMEYQTIGYTKGITLEEFLLTKERDYIKNDDAGASSIHECINYGKIYVDINIKADTEFEGMEEAYNSLQVGGIVGKNKNLIVNAINEGEIYVKRTFNSTVGVGDSGVKVGGIAGEIEYDDSTVGNYASIVNAVSTGKITAISETSEVVVGGIVGQLSDDTSDQSGIANNLVKIQNAFAATEINVQATADQLVEVGGIVGNGEGNIESCYSLDDIIASEEINKRYFGALIGNYRAVSNVSNCFYRKGTYLGAQGEDKEGITVLDSLTQSEALLYLNQNVDINNADSAKIADWLKFVEMNDTVRFEE